MFVFSCIERPDVFEVVPMRTVGQPGECGPCMSAWEDGDASFVSSMVASSEVGPLQVFICHCVRFRVTWSHRPRKMDR